MYQAGTLSGNPLATAAGLAVLDLLDHAAYADLQRRAEGLAAVLRGRSTPRASRRTSPWPRRWWASTWATRCPPTTTARATDEARYAKLFHALLDRGVAMAPGAYEVMFPGLAHTDDVLAEVAAAATEAAAVAARQIRPAATRARRWRRGPARAWARGCRPTLPSRSGAARA